MDKNRIIDISAKIALILAVVGSTAYLLMLGWYNNLLLDDYGFVADVDRDGPYGLMKNAYWHWQSRFSAFYVLGWILKIWGHASNLIGYTILLLAVGYATIYYALQRITKIQDKWMMLGMAILINNVSIMAYLELSTFYWVCCALYTLSTYTAILLFTIIFFSAGRDWLRWIIVIICSLYLCGGAENFTPLVIAILGCILLYQMISQRTWRFWQTKEQKMMLVSLGILCAGFMAVVLGPGTISRATHNGSADSFMSHFLVVPYLTQLIKASVVFWTRLLSRGLYYVLLFPIGMLIGIVMKQEGIEPQSKLHTSVLLSALVVFMLIELSLAASVFGTGWYASLRAYSFVSFIMAAFVVYCGAVCALCCNSQHTAVVCGVVTCILIAGMSISFFKQEQRLVADVRSQIESRHAQILGHKQSGRNEPIKVEEIQYPHIPNTYAIMRSMINSALGHPKSEIAQPNEYFPYERYSLSWKTADFRNRGVQRYFRVDFDMVGWAEPEE